MNTKLLVTHTLAVALGIIVGAIIAGVMVYSETITQTDTGLSNMDTVPIFDEPILSLPATVRSIDGNDLSINTVGGDTYEVDLQSTQVLLRETIPADEFNQLVQNAEPTEIIEPFRDVEGAVSDITTSSSLELRFESDARGQKILTPSTIVINR